MNSVVFQEQLASVSRRAGHRHFFSGLSDRIRLYSARSRQRRQLASLSPQQLEDVGICEHAARQEAKKYFWQD